MSEFIRHDPSVRRYQNTRLPQVIAGLATYQLALLGAEVIKVEALGTGDMCRHLLDPSEFGQQQLSPAFIGVNLNKRSIAVNLKAEQASEVLRPSSNKPTL